MPGMPAEPTDILWDSQRLSRPHEQADKAAHVRRMFDQIAPTYELVNSVTSAGRDRYWRRKMVELARVRPDDVLLDVACGTGDVARAFAGTAATRHGGQAQGGGYEAGRRWSDTLCLRSGLANGTRRKWAPSAPSGSSASTSRCPCWSSRHAGRSPRVTSARVMPCGCPSPTRASRSSPAQFGIRNFQDLARGFAEMHRVLRPGGRAVLLEFSLPRRTFLRRPYLFYIRRILPLLGRVISRDRSGAYRYLPSSVVSFPSAESIAARLREAGFTSVAVHPLTLGIVAIYVADRGGAALAKG